MYEHK